MKGIVERCSSRVNYSSINEERLTFEVEKTDEPALCGKMKKKKLCTSKISLLIKTIVGGQILSLLLCGYGTSVTVLGTLYDIHTPCFNSSVTYGILAITFGIYALTRENIREILKHHWWKFLIVTSIEVEGNFLMTKAYAYTTLTSVQLCDSFTIPTVMVISFIFLRIRYKVIHYVGVLLCLGGSILLVAFDKDDKEGNAKHEVTGDLMAISAAILYGIANAGQEVLVKKFSPLIYLGMAGIYGFIISVIQMAILERHAVGSIVWSWQITLLFIGCGIFQYLYFSTMPHVMKISSATVANLSLLTSDLYTLLVGLFLFRYKFSYFYFIAFGSITVGLFVYNLKETPHAQKAQVNLKTGKKIYSTFEDSNSLSTNTTTEELII